MSQPAMRLSEVVALDVDASGNIYLVDTGTRGVLVLDPKVGYLRTIGRGGSGPGEFRGVSSLQVLPGDTVLACDASLGRLTVFAPGSDRVLRTIPLATAHGGMPTAVIASEGSRRFVAVFEQPFVAGRPQDSDSARIVIIGIMDSVGHVARDSLLAIPGTQSLVVRSGGAVMAGSMPYGREPLLQVAAGRLFFGVTDQPILHSLPLSGGPQRDFMLPYQAASLDRDDVTKAAAALPEAMRPTFLRNPPTLWPVLRELVVTPTGEVWVEVLSVPKVTVSWIRLDSAGKPLETLALPWNTRLKAVRGDRFYAVTLDADDVPRILVLGRHPPPAKGQHS